MPNQDTTTPTTQARARLREAATKATPGPWHEPYYDDNPGDEGWWIHQGVGMEEKAVAVTLPHFSPRAEANGKYIAAADPTTILSLLDRLDSLEAENKQLRTGLSGSDRKCFVLHSPYCAELMGDTQCTCPTFTKLERVVKVARGADLFCLAGKGWSESSGQVFTCLDWDEEAKMPAYKRDGDPPCDHCAIVEALATLDSPNEEGTEP